MDTYRVLAYGLVVVVAGVFVWSNQAPPPAAPKKVVQKRTVKIVQSEFDDADFDARFDRPKVKLRNLFLPLILSTQQQTVTTTADKEDIVKIPPNLAEGDPNWAYTGFCIVDGERMALLENSVKKEAGYVKEGEAWKKSTIRRITSANIVIADADGQETVVLRYTTFVKPKPFDPAAPVTPVNPMPVMTGPINPNNIQIMPSGPGRIIRMMPGIAQ